MDNARLITEKNFSPVQTRSRFAKTFHWPAHFLHRLAGFTLCWFQWVVSQPASIESEFSALDFLIIIQLTNADPSRTWHGQSTHRYMRLTCTTRWSWKHYLGRRMYRSLLQASSGRCPCWESDRPALSSSSGSLIFGEPGDVRRSLQPQCERCLRAAKWKKRENN